MYTKAGHGSKRVGGPAKSNCHPKMCARINKIYIISCPCQRQYSRPQLVEGHTTKLGHHLKLLWGKTPFIARQDFARLKKSHKCLFYHWGDSRSLFVQVIIAIRPEIQIITGQEKQEQSSNRDICSSDNVYKDIFPQFENIVSCFFSGTGR